MIEVKNSFQMPKIPGDDQWPKPIIGKPSNQQTAPGSSNQPIPAATNTPAPPPAQATPGSGQAPPSSAQQSTPPTIPMVSPAPTSTPVSSAPASVSPAPAATSTPTSGGSPSGSPTSQPAAVPPASQAWDQVPTTDRDPILLLNGTQDDVLARLLGGVWTGSGFNAIWVPNTINHHALMLDLTEDEISFSDIPGPIPNRGLLQPTINMRGITYLQKNRNAVTGNIMHIEPGILATVPETRHPHVPTTIIRMATIPHGTSILTQGLISFGDNKPDIPDLDILAFQIGSFNDKVPLPETDLSTPSKFQLKAPGIDQSMVNNPNSLLVTERDKIQIKRWIKFDLTSDNSVAPGGGVANTAFLQGVPGEAANALATKVAASYWLEFFDDQHGAEQIQLQYSQTVILNFDGLSWPHVSVGTLRHDPSGKAS